ncbi:unnamed protein product, partial [Prorocentrum cordatum]
ARGRPARRGGGAGGQPEAGARGGEARAQAGDEADWPQARRRGGEGGHAPAAAGEDHRAQAGPPRRRRRRRGGEEAALARAGGRPRGERPLAPGGGCVPAGAEARRRRRGFRAHAAAVPHDGPGDVAGGHQAGAEQALLVAAGRWRAKSGNGRLRGQRGSRGRRVHAGATDLYEMVL